MKTAMTTSIPIQAPADTICTTSTPLRVRAPNRHGRAPPSVVLVITLPFLDAELSWKRGSYSPERTAGDVGEGAGDGAGPLRGQERRQRAPGDRGPPDKPEAGPARPEQRHHEHGGEGQDVHRLHRGDPLRCRQPLERGHNKTGEGEEGASDEPAPEDGQNHRYEIGRAH